VCRVQPELSMNDYETTRLRDNKYGKCCSHGAVRRRQWSVVGSQRSHQRGRSRGFTLAEMLISVILLAFLVLFVSRLVNSAATITTLGNKRMDADSQARQVLDRMAVDLRQMLKRNDLDYYLKEPTNLEPGNDRLAFFSAV